MAYASGKYALGICDRCGFQCDYLDMRKEWNGLKVCQECFEFKQDQLTPVIPRDVESLFEPRPNEPAPTTGYGIIRTKDDIIGSSFDMKPVTSSLGTVTVTTG
jgi:hypothetical protein